MSGHSKWSTIKHGKAVTDARRGKLFTKLTKEIIVAVREGGRDPGMNFGLRLAIQKARTRITIRAAAPLPLRRRVAIISPVQLRKRMGNIRWKTMAPMEKSARARWQ